MGTKIPSLVCSSDLTGFKFDPFNHNLLVTASDDTKIKGWIIPEDGIDKECDVTKPDWVLSAPPMDKISLVLFHPRAKGVLLSASMDRNDPTIRLWNLETQEEKLAIKGHKDVVCLLDMTAIFFYKLLLDNSQCINAIAVTFIPYRSSAATSTIMVTRLYQCAKTRKFESGTH